jgi:succinate dehydrogenase flavin-adding protein (antitoxin of CptAB toxin-antitoxin module)
MLRYNFERAVKARGIDRVYSYFLNHGIETHLASKIRQNKVTRMNPDSLEKVCLILRCTPNDIMEWVPDNKQAADMNQPLQTLRRNDKLVDLTRSLNALPLEKIEAVGRFIDEQINDEAGDGVTG